MTRLFLKLALLFSLLITIKLVFLAMSENEVSYRHAALARKEYNTLLIGSSRTQFGIHAAYLDSLNGNATKTYNFGVSAGILPYTIDWCETAVRSKKSLRYILFELSGTGGLAREYVEPWVEFRWRDYKKAWESYSFRMLSTYHDSLTLGFLKPQLPEIKYFDNNSPLERIDEAYSYQVTKTDPVELSAILSRNQTVEKGRGGIATEPDARLWQRIAGLIHLAESAGVRIRFFIPPRLQTDGEAAVVHALWRKLDERHRLRIDHAASSLYTAENSIDLFHLNHRGAVPFTEAVAAVFHP
jgi:hypothetical protein